MLHPVLAVAMTPSVLAVLLSFGLIAVILLVPVIPAVIIYKLFPDGNLADTEAAIGKIKIKAAGAWGAYMATVLLALHVLLPTTLPLINRVCGKTVWTINAGFTLQDRAGHPLDRSMAIPIVSKANATGLAIMRGDNYAEIVVITDNGEPPSDIWVSVPQFRPARIPLAGKFHDFTAEVPEPIVFRELPPFNDSGIAPVALQAGTGPSIIASTP